MIEASIDMLDWLTDFLAARPICTLRGKVLGET